MLGGVFAKRVDGVGLTTAHEEGEEREKDLESDKHFDGCGVEATVVWIQKRWTMKCEGKR